MCRYYCLISAEEKEEFSIGQSLTKGRVGIHPSIRSIYEKIPIKVLQSIKERQLIMEIEANETEIKKGNYSLVLKPNSNAKVVGIRDIY